MPTQKMPTDVTEAFERLRDLFECVIEPKRQQTRLLHNGMLIAGFNRRYAGGKSTKQAWHFYVTSKVAPINDWACVAQGLGFTLEEHPQEHLFWRCPPQNADGFKKFVAALLV